MNMETILQAETEIKKFIKRSKAVKIRASGDKFCFFGCKETAGLRRQSLELSNVLVNLRKSN